MKILAACHAHSNWSYDGSWSLSEMAKEFGSRGYQILMMTEHDRGFTADKLVAFRGECRTASTDKILVMPGIEYSDPTNTIHILTWGDVPFLGENLPTIETLRGVKKAHGIAVLAHPSRRNAWKLYRPDWSEYLMGIEIWNRKTDGWRPSPAGSRLIAETRKTAFAGMDFHTQKQLFPLGMSLELAGEVSERSVLAAMKFGSIEPYAFGRPLSIRNAKFYEMAFAPFEFGRRCLRWLHRRASVSPNPETPKETPVA